MRVLIVDDHPLFREGLRALLAGLEPSVTVEEAGSVAEALAPGERAVDLVLLDMKLPDCSGLEALRAVKAAFEHVPVVVVSGEIDPALILAAIDAGASGFVTKTTNAAVTVQALRLVLASGIYLPPEAFATVRPGRTDVQMGLFSERQLDVLQGLLQGKPNKVIARELRIAEGTVKTHTSAIFQILGVANRTAAYRRVHESGLLQQLGGIARCRP